MFKGLDQLRELSDSGFIKESSQSYHTQKMADGRILDYEAELRAERAYITGFIESLIEQEGLNGKKALVLDDLDHNLMGISASDITIPEKFPYVEVSDIPRNMEIFRANQDSKRAFAKEYVSKWQMYDQLFSQ